MQTDILIVGQGICGTLLSWSLEKLGISNIVIDNGASYAASRVAAGLINPVTGRRIVTTWMIDELLPFAKQTYLQIGTELNVEAIAEYSLLDFFPTAQMRLAFLDRLKDEPKYLQLPADENRLHEHLHYELGFGEIHPCYLINLKQLLPQYRLRLLNNGHLFEQQFESDRLSILKDGIRYDEIYASRIIFCDGMHAASSGWFGSLPFALTKGEALILEIDGLPQDALYKKGMQLIPLGGKIFWFGASNEWSYADESPSVKFRDSAESSLRTWLKHDFRVVDQLAGIRPATIERRPFVGFHPVHSSLGILNGMGTKGCSLAPYFAWQLALHIKTGAPLQPDVDVNRFKRILQKQ